MKKDLYLIGGGGHCRSCIDVIEMERKFRIIGIVDLPSKLNTQVLGYPVLATDKDLVELIQQECGFFISMGHIESPKAREKVFSFLRDRGAFLPKIISPEAHVSSHASIGDGTIVMHGAIVNAGAIIGSNCILNTNSLVEHDAIIADHCHISTGAVVNGGCRIGSGSFVGSSSVLVNGVSISGGSLVGAGSVVYRDISEGGVYVGNPCRRIR